MFRTEDQNLWTLPPLILLRHLTKFGSNEKGEEKSSNVMEKIWLTISRSAAPGSLVNISLMQLAKSEGVFECENWEDFWLLKGKEYKSYLYIDEIDIIVIERDRRDIQQALKWAELYKAFCYYYSIIEREGESFKGEASDVWQSTKSADSTLEEKKKEGKAERETKSGKVGEGRAIGIFNGNDSRRRPIHSRISNDLCAYTAASNSHIATTVYTPLTYPGSILLPFQFLCATFNSFSQWSRFFFDIYFPNTFLIFSSSSEHIMSSTYLDWAPN